MTRIGHLFDSSAGWEQRVGVSQLIERMPSDRYANMLAAIHPAALHALHSIGRPVELLGRFGELIPVSAAAVMRYLGRRGVELVHAWGPQAAAAARAVGNMPVVLQLYDPVEATREVKLLRTLARSDRFAVVCSCGVVRRRLIEGGFPGELAVIIRPGVDFGSISRWRGGDLRLSLGLTDQQHVVIMPQPITRTSGALDAACAAGLQNQVAGNVRVIIADQSRAERRIARVVGALPVPSTVVTYSNSHPFEQVLAVADTLLVTPRGDISTTAIAWAMAAGVAVIGTAVPAIAELIANKVNGLLFKQVRGRSMLPAIATLIRDRASQEKAKETARGQAYEVFGLSRSVEQYMQLYRNISTGAPPGDGINNSAIA